MIKFPKQLKIGGHVYKIRFAKETPLSENDCGKALKRTGEIYCDDGLIETEKIATLIHEVLHIINGELSEREVEFLSQAMLGVLKDNKFI